jgi:O-antigen/teichoic acid export membrane protein
MPQWGLLRKLGKVAFQHHIVNLILMAPSQLLPTLVTVLLSNDAAAYFYVSYMLANFVFSLTYSLTQVLHAVSSAQPWILAQKIRFTFGLSSLASVGANVVLQLGAGLLLATFGHAYADQAAWCLRILALAVFPIIVKSHYLAICRVYDRSKQIILPVAIGCAAELGLAAVGAKMYGLLGLSLGWFAALMLEALYMSPTVYKAANPVNVNTMAGRKPAKA